MKTENGNLCSQEIRIKRHTVGILNDLKLMLEEEDEKKNTQKTYDRTKHSAHKIFIWEIEKIKHPWNFVN